MNSYNNMKRILIIGSGGSGKSIFAVKLSKVLNINVYHLDSYFWNPGWIETPEDKWENIVKNLCSNKKWIIDGNYGGTFNIRFPQADTIIFLDIPKIICIWNVIKRRIKWHGKQRIDMGKGCPEHLDLEFLRWIWNYPEKQRPVILKELIKIKSKKNVFIFNNYSTIKSFLKSIEKS